MVTRSIGCCVFSLVLIGVAQAELSEFLKLCQIAKTQAASLLQECRVHARPFERNFYPGNSTVPVPEYHAAWFDTAKFGEHFGYGCVLGPNDQIRFLGLYYFLDAKKAKAANAAEFSFIDFNGNVGLRLSDKTSITLLAIHRLSQPGTDNPVQPANCDMGRFDPSLNQTITNGGNGYYRIMRLIDSEPATIFNCVLPDDRFDSTKCVSGQFMSYVNRSTSPIISRYNVAFSVTERGRLFVAVGFVKSVCGERVRLASEYLNFIAELCDRPVR